MVSPRNFLQDSKRDRIAKPIKECQITSDRLYYAGIDNERLSRRSYVIQPPLYYNYQCEMSAPRSVVSPRHHFVDPLTAEAYEGLRIILCKSQATLMLAHVLTSKEGTYRTWVAPRGYAAKGMRRRWFRGARTRARRGHGAYMNVKISLKLSRTSSAPWEVPVE